MPKMRIVFFPLDTGTRDINEFMTSFVLLLKEKGVKCQLTSSNGAMIKGDKEALLEILDKADFASFGIVANKISVTMEFEEKTEAKVYPQLKLIWRTEGSQPR